LISSSPDAEFEGVGVGAVVAAAAIVAMRKPLVTLIGTTRIDFLVGPLTRLPVVALNTLLSFGQVTRADLTCDASKFVASCGQLAMKPEYREVLCLNTRMRLPAIVKTLAAPTLMSAALPRLMSFACAGCPVSSSVARAKEPPMSSLLFKPLPPPIALNQA